MVNNTQWLRCSAIALWLQSRRPVGRVAELGSMAISREC